MTTNGTIRIVDQDTVTISRDEYEDLLAASDRLDRLEAAGVDNWEGYEYAFQGDE